MSSQTQASPHRPSQPRNVLPSPQLPPATTQHRPPLIAHQPQSQHPCAAHQRSPQSQPLNLYFRRARGRFGCPREHLVIECSRASRIAASRLRRRPGRGRRQTPRSARRVHRNTSTRESARIGSRRQVTTNGAREPPRRKLDVTRDVPEAVQLPPRVLHAVNHTKQLSSTKHTTTHHPKHPTHLTNINIKQTSLNTIT